jgi:hypothetical protein
MSTAKRVVGEADFGEGWYDYDVVKAEEYDKLEKERDRLKASLINMLAVFNSLDIYKRYDAVRADACEALLSTT